MTNWVPETWVSGFWKCHGEMSLKGKLNKAFLHFFGQIFGIFVDYSEWIAPIRRCCKTEKIIKYSPKKWKKALFNLLQTHISIDPIGLKDRFDYLGRKGPKGLAADNSKDFVIKQLAQFCCLINRECNFFSYQTLKVLQMEEV